MKKKLIKRILLDVMKYQHECCSVCESYGQNLPQCKCMTDAECTEHIIKLAKKAVKECCKDSFEEYKEIDIKTLSEASWSKNKYYFGWYEPEAARPYGPCKAVFKTKYTNEQLYIEAYKNAVNDILQLINYQEKY